MDTSGSSAPASQRGSCQTGRLTSEKKEGRDGERFPKTYPISNIINNIVTIEIYY